MSKTSHQERTADEEREKPLHSVVVTDVSELVDAGVRLIRLGKTTENQYIQFLPGQWLDVYVPGSVTPGGFTITSTPQDVSAKGFVELAIQYAPENLSAAWFWQQPSLIRGRNVQIRVGGSFVWPPLTIPSPTIKRVIFVAGGVGINPLVAILSHLHQTQSLPPAVNFLYSSKHGSQSTETILFLPRLLKIFTKLDWHTNRLELYRTKVSHGWRTAAAHDTNDGTDFPRSLTLEHEVRVHPAEAASEVSAKTHTRIHDRRMTQHDLLSALGPEHDRSEVVAYVCGPPSLTDWAVDIFKSEPGVRPRQVLCEKWW